jgi:NADPH:quinone reductase
VRAVVIRADGTFRLEQRPDPVAGPGEVVIRVRAAGLNAADLQQARGNYPAPAGWPTDVPGLEVAGEVEEVGSAAAGVSPGDRVMALVGGGGHADRIAVPADMLLPVPAALSWEEAAGFPEAFSTAWDALVGQAHVQAGHRVLVTGAAGGVGTALLQVAAVCGADVVASVRRPELHERVKALPGGAALDVITPDQEAHSGSYDVIVDLVGGEDYLTRVTWLRPRGKLLMLGFLAPPAAAVPPTWLGALMLNRCQLIGTTIRGRTNAEKAILARDMAAVVPMLAEGRLRVSVDSAFLLERCSDGYRRLASPGKLGKVILTTGPPP